MELPTRFYKILNSKDDIMNSDAVIRIKAVGDICPGNCSIDGFGVRSLTQKHGCDFPFQKLGDIFKETDIVVGNLEGFLSERCRDEYLRFGGLPEMAGALRNVGFDVISLANNHAFDHGAEVLDETISCCKKAELKVCGLRGNNNYHCDPVIIERKSVKIGILAYNWVGLENAGQIGDYIAVVQDSIVNYTWNRDKEKDQKARLLIKEKNTNVLSDIKRLKKEVDIVILMPHWGYEWTIYPPYGVILEARTFVDAGVNLIIGSHPHVSQGIEIFNDSLTAYSLGNFLFDTQMTAFAYGMVLECTLHNNSIEDYKYFFTRRDKFCQPELATKKEQNKNRNAIIISTKAIVSANAEKELDDDLIYRKYEKQYNLLKFKKVKHLLLGVFKNPSTIKPIGRKIMNLIELILLRLKGEKIRW